MSVNYELWLTDEAGRRLTMLREYAFFSYSRATGQLGTFAVGLPFEPFAKQFNPWFQTDWRMEVWSGTLLLPSDPLEQFRDGPADRRRLENPMRGVNRGAAMNGIRYPDPFATLRPVRIVAPRNGEGSGQAVLCDPAGLYGVQTKVGRIAGPGGATRPKTACASPM